jgi:hypothetical protein
MLIDLISLTAFSAILFFLFTNPATKGIASGRWLVPIFAVLLLLFIPAAFEALLPIVTIAFLGYLLVQSTPSLLKMHPVAALAAVAIFLMLFTVP